jgi:hypothetical protein
MHQISRVFSTALILTGLALLGASPAKAQTVYVVTGNSEFGSVDLATLVSNRISIITNAHSGLTNFNGTLYSVAQSASNQPLDTISLSGVRTDIGPTNMANINSLATNGTTIFAINRPTASAELRTVNPATGATSLVGLTGLNGAFTAFSGGTLYGSTFGSGLSSINTSTAASTFIGNGGTPGLYSQISALFDNGGSLFAFGQNGSVRTLYSVNTSTGGLTSLGTLVAGATPLTGSINGAAIATAAAAPEPTTFALLAFGAVAGGAAFARRRRTLSQGEEG